MSLTNFLMGVVIKLSLSHWQWNNLSAHLLTIIALMFSKKWLFRKYLFPLLSVFGIPIFGIPLSIDRIGVAEVFKVGISITKVLKLPEVLVICVTSYIFHLYFYDSRILKEHYSQTSSPSFFICSYCSISGNKTSFLYLRYLGSYLPIKKQNAPKRRCL